MDRARAREVKVRESRERERRDIRSSMATQERWEAGGGRRETEGESMAKRGQKGHAALGKRTNSTQGMTAVTDGQMLWGGFKRG